MPQLAFADRLLEATRARASVLCAGIDPHQIPPLFQKPNGAEALRDWAFALLPLLTGQVAVVKPQVALFERLGAAGMAVLADWARAAIDEGLLVIMDGKRGDIGTTATAYGEAWLGYGKGAVFPSHALTITPYVGSDCISEFTRIAQTRQTGLFVVLRTSNAGSDFIQDLPQADGRPLYQHIAHGLTPHLASLMGKAGYSGCGLVVGATQPSAARHLRQILPQALFLIPGYGAQGASAADALAGLVMGADGLWEGGVVNSARQLLQNDAAQTATSSSDWQTAISKSLTQTIADLRQ